jgi:hypothetical protein
MLTVINRCQTDKLRNSTDVDDPNSEIDRLELESVQQMISSFENETGPEMTASQVITAAVTHCHRSGNRRHILSLERILAAESDASDQRLAAVIDRAVSSELAGCFLANNRSTRYCVL